MNTDPPPTITRETLSVDSLRWFWANKYGRRFAAMRTFAVACMFMSVCVVWCEMTMFSGTSLSIFEKLLKSAANPVSQQIYATVPLCYICACAFFSSFRLRLSKFYHLHDEQQTDFNSLLYNAQLLLRLVVGVGYNYMILVRVESSAFLDIMGHMDVVPLFGSAFVLYFPILLVALCTATLFNWWQVCDERVSDGMG